MPVTLYRRQRQILDFVSQYIQKHGYSPTLKEIARAIGVGSISTVHEHLQAMDKKGVIRKLEGESRGIELVDRYEEKSKGMTLPVMGIISAGQPIEPYTDPNPMLEVAPSVVSGKKRAYVLHVKGSSMVEDGILDGDYVVVEEQEAAENGDIVVAVLENGFATLKRFFKEATRIRLEPANSQMSPIFAKNVRIQGKVVGIVRRYQ